MKKIIGLTIITALLLAFSACRDESLNPVPVWQPGVHAYTVFDGILFNGNVLERPQPYEIESARNFPKAVQGSARINFKIRWVSLDQKLKVDKIDIYVRMLESYNDPDGNPITTDLSVNGKGKLLTTIAAPADNRVWNAFSVTPDQIYNLYRTATVKYDKVNAVNVFTNPFRPRPVGSRFRPRERTGYGDVEADKFIITWSLHTTNDLVFNTWNFDSICDDQTAVSEANSNCQLAFIVR